MEKSILFAIWAPGWPPRTNLERPMFKCNRCLPTRHRLTNHNAKTKRHLRLPVMSVSCISVPQAYSRQGCILSVAPHTRNTFSLVVACCTGRWVRTSEVHASARLPGLSRDPFHFIHLDNILRTGLLFVTRADLSSQAVGAGCYRHPMIISWRMLHLHHNERWAFKLEYTTTCSTCCGLHLRPS